MTTQIDGKNRESLIKLIANYAAAGFDPQIWGENANEAFIAVTILGRRRATWFRKESDRRVSWSAFNDSLVDCRNEWLKRGAQIGPSGW